jgi:hypothetical protein
MKREKEICIVEKSALHIDGFFFAKKLDKTMQILQVMAWDQTIKRRDASHSPALWFNY